MRERERERETTSDFLNNVSQISYNIQYRTLREQTILLQEHFF